ncbi:hypothetical protein I6E26_05140 [Anaerovibrio lipolyticus]|uniref:glycosyltransferase family 9 protein n=1 Tax=Anaerovibrio lipolyticus TaxID=82374 RepID=UPI001F3A6B82|nr:glycosyltransferase family 9 protein [Anaerovibrio lipolyticus]MCF2600938.1 hypothetical protein [Anaerovibrio lipolyticus]
MVKIDKCLIVLLGIKNYLTKHIGKSYDKKHKNKKILILIEPPGIGDVVLLLDSLYNLSRYLNESNGYDVYLAVDESTSRFLMSCNATFGFHIIKMNFNSAHKYDCAVYKNNFSKLNFQFWDLIISADHLGNYLKLLLMGLSYGRIISSEIRYELPFLDRLLEPLLPNFRKLSFQDDSRKLVNRTVIAEAIIREAVISEASESKWVFNRYKIIPSKSSNLSNMYCCVSAGIAKGHTYDYRAWEIDKYYELLNYVISHTKVDIVLTGSEDDKENNGKLFDMLKNNERVINLTGETSFKEWIALLGNAKFVIGNDSGYIHLSYALGVQAFVIAGYWNYGRFLPYVKHDEEDAVPIDIRAAKPECVLCAYGNSNPKKHECDLLVKEKGIYKCIDDITVKNAIKVIYPWLKKKNLIVSDSENV